MTPATTENSFWLFLHPYVHLNVKKHQAVLYNTLNGTILEYHPDSDVGVILKELNKTDSLFVIKIKEENTCESIAKFISEIRESYTGDIVDVDLSDGKPVQLKPMLHLETNLDALSLRDKSNQLRNDEIQDYITSLTLYINNTCFQNCRMCSGAYKQFPVCRSLGNYHEELKLEKIVNLLGNLDNSGLRKLVIAGGDITKYSELLGLIDFLNSSRFRPEYHIHYLNLSPDFPLHKIADHKGILNIFAHFPLDKDQWHYAIKKSKASGLSVNFHFIVEKEEHVHDTESQIKSCQIENTVFHPFYNGNNSDFFKSNVFITRSALQESGLSMKTIFARSVINTLDFRSLIVSSDGSLFANINHPRLGVVDKDQIYTFIEKELNEGESWTKVRKNIMPCKSCAYNSLCPPISNYEYTFRQYNLCRIWDDQESPGI